MFGGAIAVRDEILEVQLVGISNQFGARQIGFPVLLILAKHAKEDPSKELSESGLDLWQIRSLMQVGIVSAKHGRYILSKRGRRMAIELANRLPDETNWLTEQWTRLVQDARTDWEKLTTPFFLDSTWWRQTIWAIRKWWAGTKPERRVIDMGEIKAHPLWTEADEARNTQMWRESRFKAFWLCPGGVDQGLQYLNSAEHHLQEMEFEEKNSVADKDTIDITELSSVLEKPRSQHLIEKFDRIWDEVEWRKPGGIKDVYV